MKIRTLLLITLLSNAFSLFSQNNSYNELLVGKLYSEGNRSVQGHVFYGDNKFYDCKMQYKDLVFNDLKIKYDLFLQQIILYQEFETSLPRFIVLNNRMIKYFEIEYNGLIQLFSADFSNLDGVNSSIKFYQIVYNKDIKYIIGRKKTIEESSSGGKRTVFKLREYNYLIIDNEVFRIRNKRDFFNAFGDSKNEVKKFAKNKKLKIKIQNYNIIDQFLTIYESNK